MRLSEWREQRGWTLQQLANVLRCSVSTVWRYEQGLRDPETSIKQRIFEVTNGSVQPNDFYDVPGWRRLISRAVSVLSREAA